MTSHRALAIAVLVTAALAIIDVPAGADEPSQEARVEAKISRVGTFMAIGFNALWLVGNDRLTRINLSDNSIVKDIDVPGTGSMTGDVAVGEGAVWVPALTTIYKIDPEKNAVVKKIDANLTVSLAAIAAGEGSLWAITGSGRNKLTRYSPESGAVEVTIPLPSQSRSVLVAFGSVWVTGTGNDELYRIDPVTNRITATTELHSSPHFMAAEDGCVWVLNDSDGSVQRIDGTSGALVATIETGEPGVSRIEAGGAYVWVAINFSSYKGVAPVIQIDPRSNSIRRKFDVQREAYIIRYGGSSLWASGAEVRRITPPP